MLWEMRHKSPFVESTAIGIRPLFIIIYLYEILISSTVQIPGNNPALPGVFPNMFPLTTGQVCISLMCM